MPTPRALAVLPLVAALACSRGDPGTGLPPARAIERNPLLAPFASCAELERSVEDDLVLRMRSVLEQNRRGFAGVPALAADGRALPAAAAPSEYTRTNEQVEGVGEADFLQNDGTRIAVVAGGALHLARSWPPEALARTASIAIEGWPSALFLAGDVAVVFSGVYVPRALEGDALACPAILLPGGGPTCGYFGQNAVKITTVDVSDLAAPAVTSELYLPGGYVSARRIGERVRLVTSDTLPFPAEVVLWAPVAPGASDAERDAAYAALAAANEELIRARSLDDWLRRGTLRRPGAADVDLGYACTEFARSTAPVRPGILTVSTLDVAAGAVVSRTSVLAEPGVVYASPTTLYVASQHWWWWPEPGQRDATYVHAFDLADPDRAPYLGSGVVDGSPRDPYALDEHEGALRAVTTVTERVGDGTPWGRVETAARLSVLKLEGSALRLVGETPAFGKGETVFGTRFVGARGFAITARQIDPLFTFDLSDPASPTIVGELEMPGFIAYLHPVDDTHLLGVGAQRAADGRNQVKVTLLDVVDLAAPREIETVLVGEGWASSDVLWDPKAFTWLGARKLLAIPFADWGTSQFTSDLRLFRVDPASGVTPAGSLSMADVYLRPSGFDWSWSPYVRRGILASDEVDEYVYAVSDAGVRTAKVSGLDVPLDPLATIQFPPLAHP